MIKSSGKKMPSKKTLQEWGGAILSKTGPRCAKYTLQANGKPDQNVYYLAQHTDVMAVLKGRYKNNVDISSFDDVMQSGVGKERFFSGKITQSQDNQWNILKAAISLEPKLGRTNTSAFLRMGDEAVSTAIQDIHARNKRQNFFIKIFQQEPHHGRFNGVRDYGYLVPYLAATEMTGIIMPDKPSFLLRIIMFFRRVIGPDRKKLKGNLIPSTQMWLWVLIIFGHLFANFSSQKKYLQKASKWASGKILKQIMLTYNELEGEHELNLLSRLKKVRSQFPNISDEQYEIYVRSLALEFVGSFHVVIGTAFCKMIDTLYDHKISIGHFVKLFDKNEMVIDEILRINTPNAILYRSVIKPIKIEGKTINPGDTICLLVDHACKDPRVFVNPDVFSDFSKGAPKRNPNDYLTFGPNEITPNSFRPTNNIHPCFGQYWARTIIKCMFKGLLEFENLRPQNQNKPKVKNLFGLDGIPGAFMFEYDQPKTKQEPPQTLVTICSEIKKNKDGSSCIANVQKKLDALGNPVCGEALESLENMDTLHFISMHVIAGVGDKEPDYLLLEMSVDGTEGEGIEALCTHASKWLLPIYKSANCIKDDGKLNIHLQDSSLTLKQTFLPEFYNSKWCTGVAFSGTDGLSVKRIRAEQRLAVKASETLTKPKENNSHLTITDPPAQELLQSIRSKIQEDDDLQDDLWVLENSTAPVFADRRQSEWLTKWSNFKVAVKVFPNSLLAMIGVLYLVVASMMWNVLFGENIAEQTICGPTDTCTEKNNILNFPFQFKLDDDFKLGDFLFLELDAGHLYAITVLSLAFTIFMVLLSARIPRIRLKKIGNMFWFLLAFISLLYLPAIFNLGMTAFLPESDFLKREITIIALQSDTQFPKFEHLLWLAGIATIGLWAFKGRARALPVQNPVMGYLSFYLIVVLFGAVILQQYALVSMPATFGETKFHVYNRYLSAKLSDIIFFPLILATILTAFVYAFNVSFPNLGFIKKNHIYFTILFILYVMIFTTSFLSWQGKGDVTLVSSSIMALLMGLVVPLLAAVCVCAFYLHFAPILKGQRNPRQTYWRHVALATLLISFAFNMTHQPRGLISTIINEWMGNITWIGNIVTSRKVMDMEPSREKLVDILFAFGVALPVLLVLVLGIAGLAWIALYFSEKNNTPHDSDANINTIEDIMNKENQTAVHNHMFSVTRLLPEQFRRRVTLPFALKVMITSMVKGRVRPGNLGSVGTVHFARWVLLPRTNNYIFASNYDGSFESYLEDFITKLGAPLNGAWSHSVGYPKTSNIFSKGSEDGDRFIRFARGSMRPTPFWYSAYDDLSVEQIRRNALIRDGLARINSASDAEAWLDLFNSVTRPEHALQSDQIQSLVFGGSGKLAHGCCLVVQSNTTQEADTENAVFQNWLTKVGSHITYGEIAPHNRASYLALSAEGFKSCGLAQDLRRDKKWTGNEELEGEAKAIKFSSAFVLGMNSPTRSNMLGDTGDSASHKWTWGKKDDPTQAVLLLHAVNAGELDKLRQIHTKMLDDANLKFHQIQFRAPNNNEGQDQGVVAPLAKEPFGFVDGISNPIIRGTLRAAKNPNSIHLVNPGEFILGYKDNREYFPPSPQIETCRDHKNILPAIPNAQPQKYPYFQNDDQDNLRDLGRNGTYLVIRQLEQNVEAFKDESLEKAKEVYPEEFQAQDEDILEPDQFESRKENAKLAVQAKMMGRWHDGRPLVADPVKTIRMPDGKMRLLNSGQKYSDDKFDNEFLFGRDDAQGHSCPYGSHIRRCNPRDSLNPNDENELDISNRHRLMRRGRAYTEGDDTGTFFMCLNANIQRQFEFVQQTWVGSPNFHGLQNEIDPIAGQNARDGQGYTIQAPGRDQTISTLQSFITMKGGGYFFMPSRDALSFISTYKR